MPVKPSRTPAGRPFHESLPVQGSLRECAEQAVVASAHREGSGSDRCFGRTAAVPETVESPHPSLGLRQSPYTSLTGRARPISVEHPQCRPTGSGIEAEVRTINTHGASFPTARNDSQGGRSRSDRITVTKEDPPLAEPFGPGLVHHRDQTCSGCRHSRWRPVQGRPPVKARAPPQSAEDRLGSRLSGHAPHAHFTMVDPAVSMTEHTVSAALE